MERIFRVDFYPHEWLSLTAHMTPEQRGIFITVVAMIYAHRGAIVDDAAHVGRMANCSSRLARSLLDSLHPNDLQIGGGFIRQKRAEDELNKKRTHLELSAKGGRTKAEKEHENNKNNALPSTEDKKSVASSSLSPSLIAKDNPPTPSGGVEAGTGAGKPPKVEGHKMPHAGELPPPAWGNWAMGEFSAPRSLVVEQWVLYRDHWTVGKGKNTKRTEHGWEITWRNWCRKAFAGYQPKAAGGQNPALRSIGGGAETV